MLRPFLFRVSESSLAWLGKQSNDRGLSIAAYLRLLILDAERRAGQ